ncbi:MAG: hypothetical protein U5O15_08800 [Candidatus Krumholzibacteriota bacterium]|nr:hypothetical protein [Candidatus Krumholzibacteriota bacterium]
MTRFFFVLFAVIAFSACGDKSSGTQEKKLNRAEKDSVLSESALPGAKAVGKAIAVSDSASARTKRLDESAE